MNQTLHLLGLSLALTACAQAAPIINEVLSSNRTIFADEDGDFGDWVEIYNPDAAAYKLDGHFLTASAKDLWVDRCTTRKPGVINMVAVWLTPARRAKIS